MRVTEERFVHALATWKGLALSVAPVPRPVGLDRFAVEVTGSTLVEALVNEYRYWTAAQSDLKR
jgi:hypothetical protein